MRSSRLFEDILRCVEAHPGSELDELAAAMHYSKYHLHHLFSDTAGISGRIHSPAQADEGCEAIDGHRRIHSGYCALLRL